MRKSDHREREFSGKLDLGGRRIFHEEERFTGEQIVAALKQAELGMALSDLIRQMRISEQTFYRWKKQYAGL